MFYNILWSGKSDKIKRSILTHDYNGWLRMVDLNAIHMRKIYTVMQKEPRVKLHCVHMNFIARGIFHLTSQYLLDTC